VHTQDQAVGINLLDVQINPETSLQSAWREDLGGIMTVEADGFVRFPEGWESGLYRRADPARILDKQKIHLVAIPYYAWGNRGLNSMRVWIPATEVIHNSVA
jgi:uncharacterized protein